MGIANRLIMRKSKIDMALLQNVVAVNYRAIYEALEAIEINCQDPHGYIRA